MAKVQLRRHRVGRNCSVTLQRIDFVVTDAQGNFRLGDLPAGHYTLKAWLDSRTTLERPVDLGKIGTLQANFP